MKLAEIKKHESRQSELVDEAAGWFKNPATRTIYQQVEENTKTRAAFHLLEGIRALQQTEGYDAEKILEAIVSQAEWRLQYRPDSGRKPQL